MSAQKLLLDKKPTHFKDMEGKHILGCASQIFSCLLFSDKLSLWKMTHGSPNIFLSKTIVYIKQKSCNSILGAINNRTHTICWRHYRSIIYHDDYLIMYLRKGTSTLTSVQKTVWFILKNNWAASALGFNVTQFTKDIINPNMVEERLIRHWRINW